MGRFKPEKVGNFFRSLQFLTYEEFGWYLLSHKNPENAGDILLNIYYERGLDNHSMRWLTLALYWSSMLRMISPKISLQWFKIKHGIEIQDSLAICLCAMYSPPDISIKLLELINESHKDKLMEIGSSKNFEKNWFTLRHEGYSKLLASILDLDTTGGIYSDNYNNIEF